MQYPVVIHKDPDSDYGVTVPDLPGCFSAGESIEEALEGAREAIECHLEGLLMDEEDVPLPEAIDAHRNDENYRDGIWALVSVDITQLSGKTKRINVSVPERILKKIDGFAARHNETRSGFLVSSALEVMGRESVAAQQIAAGDV
jgi:predicted RNase H-like HicB family nuclease